MNILRSTRLHCDSFYVIGEIQGVNDEAVVNYRDPLTTQEIMKEAKKEEIVYRSLEPGMSEALVKCIRSVYGDSYPLTEFYDPDCIESLIKQKLLYSEVAINQDGEIIANLSTQLEKVGDRTADASAGMVAAPFRGYGTILQLGMRMVSVYEELGLCGVQLYSITLHTITQKLIADGGGILTGVLPAHFPKGTTADGFKGASGRVGVVSFYMPLKKLPSRSVYVPLEYKEQICNIYKQVKCDREVLRPSKDKLATDSIYEITSYNQTGVIHMRLDRVGSDTGNVLNFLDATAFENASEVDYLDIPLNDSACGFAVDLARAKGFVYGNLILERGNTDRLRLQKLDNSTFLPENMQLTSEAAKSFLNLILKEIDSQ